LSSGKAADPDVDPEVGERIRALLREGDFESAAAYSRMVLDSVGIEAAGGPLRPAPEVAASAVPDAVDRPVASLLPPVSETAAALGVDPMTVSRDVSASSTSASRAHVEPDSDADATDDEPAVVPPEGGPSESLISRSPKLPDGGVTHEPTDQIARTGD
jgi:hypothetical protein